MNEKTLTVTMKRIDLCNLILACTNTIAHLEANGKTAEKWYNLHDLLKDALEGFDAEQDT